MSVIDISSYDLDTFNAHCFAANGVTGVIVGVFSATNAPDRMRTAAQACRDAGLKIHGFYGVLYFGSPFGLKRDAQWAIDLAKEFGVSRVWLDVETDGVDNGFTDGSRPTPAQRARELGQVVQMVRTAGLSPGIYTYRPFWLQQMGSTSEFRDLPLWFASYGQNDPDHPIDPITSVNFGGWTQCAIHQYSSTIMVCGRERDHNYVFEGEDDMTPEEVNKLVEAFVGATFPAYVEAYFSGGFSARNGVVSDLNPEGKGPIKPWLEDIGKAVHTVVLPQVASEGAQ
jgi:GH25 family lysozyme M1 (1,4-beta-N-acetylmuramidase)